MALVKKKMLWRDIAATFRKSKGRFLSIACLIALGSFALVGLKVTGPDMRATGEHYFGSYDLSDLTVIGDLGLSDDDVADIKRADGAHEVEFGYLKDVTVKGTDDAVRVESKPEHISQFEVTEGRLPEHKDEIAIDARMADGHAIGSTIKFNEKEDASGSKALARHSFKVVGYVNSTEIVSKINMGQTQAGSGDLAGYAVVMPEAFDVDYYMLARVTYKDTEGLDPYSATYLDRVSAHKVDLEALLDRAPERRLDGVRSQYDEQIDEGQAKVDDAKQQLADAKATLDDAAGQLADGHAQIADSEGKLTQAAGQLDTGRAELARTWNQLEDARIQLVNARATLDASAGQLSDAQVQLASGKQQLADGYAQLATKQAEYEEKNGEYQKSLATYNAKKQEYNEGVQALAAAKQQAERDAAKAQTELDEKSAQLEQAQQAVTQLPDAIKQLDAGIDALNGQIQQAEQQGATQEQLDALKSQLAALTTQRDGYQAQLDAAQQALEAVGGYDAGKQQITAAQQQLNEQVAEGQKQLAAKQAELDAADAQLTEANKQLESARKQLDTGKSQLDAAAATLAAKQAEYNQGLAAYNQGKTAFEAGTAQYNEGRTAYYAGLETWKSAQATLMEKTGEYEDGVAALNAAKATLASKESEYEDGLAAYNEKLPDAQTQIANAETSLADAREARDTLEKPAYSVSSRRETPGSEGYITYDSVSEIIDSLANIFPYFMYLVAALVASTTMTRMVDEERINSGTLKALGYRDKDVMKKFAVYGAAAGGIGSIVGIIAGHTLIPIIVNNAYSHGFTLPAMELHFYPLVSCAALALGLAVAVVPAVIVAKREVAEKPAQLLLPKPPAGGSKVILERITPLWNRLNFTQKVTFRNLLRYKKRMLMTVIGVAGAVCLMFTGFAVQHSIDGLSEKQFGDIIGYDLIVAENPHVNDEERQAIDKQLDSDAVAAHSPVTYEALTKTAGSKGDDQDIALIVPQDIDAFTKYMNIRDRKTGEELPLGDSGAVISERLATLTGTKVGDDFTFTDADGVERTVKITGICEMYMNHFMFMSPAAYQQVFGNEPATNAHVVTLHDGSLDNTRHEAARFMDLDGVLGVVQSAALINQVNVIVTSLNKIMLVLIAIAILLALVIVYNLVSINVAERIRELSTIKVLGFFDNEVSMYIYRETIINAAIALPVGWLLGWLLQQYVITAVPPETVMFDPSCGWLPFAVSTAVVVAVVAVMYVVVNRQLKNVDMLEALKSVD